MPERQTGQSTYYGHSANQGGHWEPVWEHARAVAERARGFASVFGAGDHAEAAGLVHDLGKYADQFQRRLRHPHSEAGRDHSSAGAALAAACYRHIGRSITLAVQGHHVGLQILEDYLPLLRGIRNRMRDQPETFTDTDLPRLKARFDADGMRLPKLGAAFVAPGTFDAAEMLEVRMLFSALVDADFVETEAHFNGTADAPRRYRPTGAELDPAKAFAVVDVHVRTLRDRSQAETRIQDVRNRLYDTCCEAAVKYPPGLFTLSAPTGSGKTLAMLAFALRHAERHGLRRVVVVLPFLNIIEQTASVYRDLFTIAAGFGEQFVIEDHSLAHVRGRGRTDGVDEADRIPQLLAENWDAPIVLTSNVKCLESLMSNRPAACRKLHRLAGSVLLFDEVQTLPPALAVPTLATLSHLADRFGATVVFATATQPAFDHLHEKVQTLCPRGWQPVEILQDAPTIFQNAAHRVQIRWRHDEPIELAQLADDIAEADHDQFLCIVNLKRHAAALAELLKQRGLKGLLHLSTSMCPAHRERALARARRRLDPDNPKPVRLIATQCVEAGVDLDFPVVYRALAPLEAIAQAAGRCNRHGARAKPGVVHVFKPAADRGKSIYPPGYREAANATGLFLSSLRTAEGDLDQLEIIHAPHRLSAYFRHFYDLTGISEGAKQKQRDLAKALQGGDFAEVAKLYRLIDQDTINVLVPFKPGIFKNLRDEILETDPLTPDSIRNWISRARLHTVSLYRPRPDAPVRAHLQPIPFSRRQPVDEDRCDWFYCLKGAKYDEELLGLQLPDEIPTII